MLCFIANAAESFGQPFGGAFGRASGVRLNFFQQSIYRTCYLNSVLCELSFF